MGLVDRYSKYGSGGGYNYWHSAKSAITDMTTGQQSYDQAVGHCTKVAKSDESIANQNIAKRFQDWRAGQDLEYLEPPVGIISGPRGVVSVKVEPDFAYKAKGQTYVALIWPYANKTLRKKIAGIGVHMMKSTLSQGPFSNATFYILDLSKSDKKPTRFLHGAIPKNNPDGLLAYMLDLHELAYIQTHPKAA